MSEVEKMIDLLKHLEVYKQDNSKNEFIYYITATEAAGIVDFLKTLQPNGNEEVDVEYLEACAKAGGMLLSGDEDGTISGFEISSISGGRNYEKGFPRTLTLQYFGCDGYHEHIKYVQELSAPKPFDVLDHLNNDGIIQQVGFQSIKVRFYDARFQNLSLKKEWLDIEDLHMFFTELVMEDWEVSDNVETEPTPQELLEKARFSIDDVFGKGRSKEIKSINAALDAYEKLIP